MKSKSPSGHLDDKLISLAVRKQLLALLCLVTLVCAADPILVGPTRDITDPAAGISPPYFLDLFRF